MLKQYWNPTMSSWCMGANNCGSFSFGHLMATCPHLSVHKIAGRQRSSNLAQNSLSTDKERESCFCPFLDIVDNHNNTDKFQSTLLCSIARRHVCLSKEVLCSFASQSERQRQSRVEEKYSSWQLEISSKAPPSSLSYQPPSPSPSLSPPGFNKGRLVYRRNITGLLLSVQSSLHTALSYFHLKLHIR